MTFKAIVELLLGLIQAIPILDKWFNKSTEAKVEDSKKDIDNEKKEFEETGRPPK